MRSRKLADDDRPLREDIRLLGRLLGETIREQEGGDAFETVETVRQLAVRFRRDGDAQARNKLVKRLNALSRDRTVSVVRAFSYFSHLANIAEDVHANRGKRADALAGKPAGEGSLAFAFKRIAAAQVAPKRVRDFFEQANLTAVLTAHPQKSSARASWILNSRSRD